MICEHIFSDNAPKSDFWFTDTGADEADAKLKPGVLSHVLAVEDAFRGASAATTSWQDLPATNRASPTPSVP